MTNTRHTFGATPVVAIPPSSAPASFLRSLFSHSSSESGPSPVLSAEVLHDVAEQVLGMMTADIGSVRIDHRATGSAHVAQSRLRLNDSGDDLRVLISAQFGKRVGAFIDISQIDRASLRDAVTYVERLAREQPGDPTPMATPIPPRTYLPVTTWKAPTVAAYDEARHAAMPTLIGPLLQADLTAAAFAGVSVHSTVYAAKTGIVAYGQETDTEITVTGWSPDGRGSAWAGQAARDWTTLKPGFVAGEALRLTKLSANPVALEPGRRMAILDRAAVAQLVYGMGGDFAVQRANSPGGVLYDKERKGPKLGQKVMDERMTLSSDPNDPDGGFLPFNIYGDPLIPMRWIESGVLTHIAWDAYSAAAGGVTPSNDAPYSIRVSGGTTSVDEMIANCKTGVYVRRLTNISTVDTQSGMVTGFTTGGCFLVKNGKIEKAVKNFRFLASPWFVFNAIEALGPTERTALGYAPWFGPWPLAPTIVPPVTVRDFNFVALADAV